VISDILLLLLECGERFLLIVLEQGVLSVSDAHPLGADLLEPLLVRSVGVLLLLLHLLHPVLLLLHLYFKVCNRFLLQLLQ
jgi:hypothetical protein